MACRLPRYLPIMPVSSFSQEALDGLDGVAQSPPFGIGKRCLAQAAQPVGGIRPSLEPARHRHQLRESSGARVMGVGIAFDQSTRLEQFDSKRNIAARRRPGLIEPGLEMRLLTPMAQRAAPKPTPTRQSV